MGTHKEETVAAASSVSRRDGLLIWLTGLSCSGKSSLAGRLSQVLSGQGQRVVVLDGDEMRRGLCQDLGFSLADRAENVRRIGEVALLFMREGCTVVAACISPIRASRLAVRQRVAAGRFIEVYLHCPLEVCRQRDQKGNYERARLNQIAEFTGLTSPYEPPLSAELELRTDRHPVDECVSRVLEVLPHPSAFQSRGI